MQIGEHVDAIGSHAAALADCAERAGPAARVPTCPEWSVADLVRHQGFVHRWAALHVGERRPGRAADEEVGPLPDGDELLPWYREGVDRLVATLRSAPADLECWSFLPAPSPLAFWARRQAHETAVHHADAAAAMGELPTVAAALAVDGIDELLCGFFGRPRGRLVSEAPVRLGLQAEDSGDAWTMTIGPDGRSTAPRLDTDADCVVRATAPLLYLFVWNRAAEEAVRVDGDRAVLELWRERARISWS
jgi:uncharacterized protein (TIGR03083 family)